MGRKDDIKKIVLCAFSNTKENSKIYRCNFCTQNYTLNVTRMSDHLRNKCIRCPSNLKRALESKSRASSVMKVKAINKDILKEKNASVPEVMSDDDGNGISCGSRPQSSATASTASSVGSFLIDGNLDSFIDSINKSEEEEIWDLLATACFASNTPLNFTENEHWRKLFKKIKPSLQLPSRHQLSNFLLNKQYAQIRNLVNEKISNAKTFGIQIDGWSNVRNESIINIIITTPEPLLFKVIDCKDNRHDATYLCSLVSSIIDELGVNKVTNIVTDNASNMKSAWKLINDKYPRNYFSCNGCFAHILNLFAHDILKLEPFKCLTNDCKAIVKSIKKSHILSATFKSIQDEQHILQKSNTRKSLQLPGQTRWCSITFCLQSLIINKRNLKELVITESVANILDENIKQKVLNDLFWAKVDTLYEILNPVSIILKNVQTSRPCISHVVNYFHDLKDQLQSKCPVSELNTILSLLNARRDMAITPLHLAANLLDPKIMGKHLSNDEYIAALTYINKLSTLLVTGSNVANVMTEIAYYKSKEELFSNDFIWKALDTGELHSVIWWKSLCCTTSLSKVATEILNCSATTCATERSFSVFSTIQSKKRNRLTNERASKLLYVNLNLKLKELSNMNKIPTVYSDSEISESADNDSDLE